MTSCFRRFGRVLLVVPACAAALAFACVPSFDTTGGSHDGGPESSTDGTSGHDAPPPPDAGVDARDASTGSPDSSTPDASAYDASDASDASDATAVDTG